MPCDWDAAGRQPVQNNMLVIYLLIPLSIVLLALAVWAFFWAVNNGQFDDLDTPAERILHDDDEN
jgi:cbb3-type cytochrome oxidase maturation protein